MSLRSLDKVLYDERLDVVQCSEDTAVMLGDLQSKLMNLETRRDNLISVEQSWRELASKVGRP